MTLAGLKKLVADGRVGKEETAVLLLTGHTLKDSEYTIKYHLGELLTEAEMAGAARQRLRGIAELAACADRARCGCGCGAAGD